MAGRTDLLQGGLHCRRIMHGAAGNVGIADNRVHRGEDVVGHVGHEVIAGICGGFCQTGPECFFPLHLGIDVVRADDQQPAVAVIEQGRLHADIDRVVIEHQTVFYGEAAVPFRNVHDLFLAEDIHEAVIVFRIDYPAHVLPAQIEKVFSLFFRAELMIVPRGAVFEETIGLRIHNTDAGIVTGQGLGYAGL